MTTTLIVTLVCAALLILFCRIIDGIFTRLHKLEEALSKAKLEDLQKPVNPGKPAAAAVTDLWKLEKELSSQRRFLNDIHVVLQRARMMPWTPTQAPVEFQKQPCSKGFSLPVISRPVKSYDVVSLRNGQITGYLAVDGTWTLDPNFIWKTTAEEDAKVLCSKVVLSEGVTAQVREHSSEI